MKLTKNREKYFAFIRIALRNEVQQWPMMIGRLLFFVILMVVFSSLWRTAFKSGMRAAASASDMLWYLAATEWITLSIPWIHAQVEDDVRSGSYAYFLGRPLSYAAMRLAEGIGQILPRAILLAAAGFTITFLAAGSGPQIGWKMPIFLLLGFSAALILLVFHLSIGLCALWFQEATPIYWVWQKFLFILGGLMLPLSIYPLWLQKLAAWLPFYAMLYAPGRLMIAFDAMTALETLALLIFWGAAAVLLLAALSKKAIKTVEIGGG